MTLADRPLPAASSNVSPAHAETSGRDEVPPVATVLVVTVARVLVIAGLVGVDGLELFLAELERRLIEWAGPDGSVKPMGGGAYRVLIEGDRTSGTQSGRAQALADQLRAPITIGGLEIVRPVRIGAAAVSHGGVENATLAALNAVNRLEQARRFGAMLAEPDWAQQSKADSEMELMLGPAIGNGELRMDYQPEFDLRTREIVAVEALARWDHPRLGPLDAERFIGMADASGFASQLHEWSIRTACAQLAAWARDRPHLDIVMRVNVSTAQLSKPTFPALLERLIAEGGANPRRLCLEITEHVRSPAPAVLQHVVREVRAAGVQVALDDFGAGRNGLLRLSGLPVDVIKIDRSLTTGLTRSASSLPRAGLIVSTIVQMARGLGIDVVAEGIETEEILSGVLGAGCFRGQGYLLGGPTAAAQVFAITPQN